MRATNRFSHLKLYQGKAQGKPSPTTDEGSRRPILLSLYKKHVTFYTDDHRRRVWGVVLSKRQVRLHVHIGHFVDAESLASNWCAARSSKLFSM